MNKTFPGYSLSIRCIAQLSSNSKLIQQPDYKYLNAYISVGTGLKLINYRSSLIFLFSEFYGMFIKMLNPSPESPPFCSARYSSLSQIRKKVIYQRFPETYNELMHLLHTS